MKKKIGISLVLIAIILFSVGVYATTRYKPTTRQIVQVTKPTALGENQLQYYFSQPNHDTDQDLIKVINSAKSNLDIAIYSLTKSDIVDAIIAAKNRGVNVRIITDKQESKSKSEKAELTVLSDDNIPIKINEHSGLMHLKVTIADKAIVTTGSYNYTNGATYENDEVLVVIDNQNIAQDWDKKFESMWDDNKKFSNY